MVDMSKEEQIGYHKGSLNTLLKEREELVRIVSVVDNLVKVHVKGLQDLGVDLTQNNQQNTNNSSNSKEDIDNIEDIMKN